MVVAWQRMTSPLKNKSKAGVERLRKAKRDNAKKEVKKIKTLAKELAYVISIDSCTRQLLSQIHYMHDYRVHFLLFSVTNHFSSVSPLRTVPTIVNAHTFCASQDTRISYRQCLLIQGYFCAV